MTGRRFSNASIGLALVVAALLAACGSSSLPGVASVGPSSSTTVPAGISGNSGKPPSPRQLRALTAYAACVRKHGLPKFPNPPYGNGELAELGFSKVQLSGAEKSCHTDALAAGVVPNQAAIQQRLSQTLAIARCMRTHGVPNFPDPNSSGQFPAQAGLDIGSPGYTTAAKQCGAPYGAPHGG